MLETDALLEDYQPEIHLCMDIIDTQHFNDVLREREIDTRWVARALDNPDRTEDHNDGTRHFLCQIPDRENRWLRVVVNVSDSPCRAVTVYFDRGLRTDP